MIVKMIFFALAYVTILICDKVFSLTPESEYPAAVRKRILRFAVIQDVIVLLNIMKMIVFEGYTLPGLGEQLRNSGLLTRLYAATSAVLHGALLFDEATSHRARLTPVPYLPPSVGEDQKDLFLL